jgi:aminopeptidase S
MLRRTADTLALGPRRGSAKLSVALPLPASCGTAVLSLQRHIATTERRGGGAQDTLKVQLLNRAGRLLTTLSTLSNRNAASGYGTVRLNLARYTGQKLTLRFLATRTGARTTSFTLRLVALRLS